MEYFWNFWNWKKKHLRNEFLECQVLLNLKLESFLQNSLNESLKIDITSSLCTQPNAYIG